MAKRDKVAERKVIADRYPHVRPAFLPSPYRHPQFEPWVLWSEGCDDQGNFIGYCPMHDDGKETEASAIYNFLKDVIRCQGDPSCHDGQRAMSLTNVWAGMQSREQV